MALLSDTSYCGMTPVYSSLFEVSGAELTNDLCKSIIRYNIDQRNNLLTLWVYVNEETVEDLQKLQVRFIQKCMISHYDKTGKVIFRFIIEDLVFSGFLASGDYSSSELMQTGLTFSFKKNQLVTQ